jgi:rhodanese-related sulfurtransferase
MLPLMACGQSKSHPHCGNKAFDTTVSTLLHFTVPTISCTELYSNQSKYILLDARERKEYDVSHIRNAQYVGYDQFSATSLSQLSKDAPIVVYCSVGYRSEKVGEKLQALGFKNVKNLYGSIFEWVNKGYEVVDNSGQIVNKVHSYNALWAQYIKNKKMEKVN